ncbi:VC0807 family protein [Amycolatopsis rhabdoformis]|uniref:VC0807 family protein n=1 Tax=Amycolatopsis rhabdoformis TaxID=1448059 RepID=A0ABZ1I3W6_9PSEU|nr:VC0807 family protein [Amycolatopsis rhabdoformis]WSE28626.1 VC0807 family protein [Amycolatopsis rhabdoformis]
MGKDFRSSAFALLIDIGAPVGGYYLLRAFGVAPVWALVLSGLPPAARILYTAVRQRRLDGMGLFVLAIVAVSVTTSLWTGDARLLLIRNAWFSTLAGFWLLASLFIGKHPVTYTAARALLPGKGPRFDALWDQRPSFRHVWRVLAVAWGVGGLLHSAISIGIAYSLPIDDVPALDTVLSIVFFVLLQIITQLLLFREGSMRAVLRPEQLTTQ